MHETEGDVHALNQLIEDSITRAGPFLRSSFEMPEKSLSAGQIIRHFDGVSTVAFATANSAGLPRVAPVIAVLYRARFHVPTVQDALRAKHVRKKPEVSLTAYEGVDFALIIHGRVSLLDESHPDFEPLRRIQLEHDGSDIIEWGDPVYLRVDPTHLFSFARYPERFPDLTR